MSEILPQMSDVDAVPTNLKVQMLERIGGAAPNAVWTPADFLDLAGRNAFDKTLQRLAEGGKLRRLDRGLYDRPCFNSLTQNDSPPGNLPGSAAV